MISSDRKKMGFRLGLGSGPRRDPDSEINSIHFGIEINKFLRPKSF